jgi:hypothetical protein
MQQAMIYNANSLRVKYSYLMARELARASAAIRQRHYEAQQSDPDYWEADKLAQANDGVTPDPTTGVAVPIIHMSAPGVVYERGEPDHEAANQRFQAEATAALEQQQREHTEVEKNGASIIDMVKAGPKIISAMLKPSDSPMALKRLEVCKGCEHWTGSKCKKCGCFTSLKVRLPSEACPIGKWSKEE